MKVTPASDGVGSGRFVNEFTVAGFGGAAASISFGAGIGAACMAFAGGAVVAGGGIVGWIFGVFGTSLESG